MLYRPDEFKRALVYSVKNSRTAIVNKVIRFGGNLDDDLGEVGVRIPKSTTQCVSSTTFSRTLEARCKALNMLNDHKFLHVLCIGTA